MVEFGLSASTIATIVSNKVKIIAEHEKNKSENDQRRNAKTIKIRNPTYKDVDSAVQQWFNETMSNTNVTMGGNEIKAQALKYAIFLNHPDFTASNGCLSSHRQFNS